MITEELRGKSQTYACNLAAGLKERGFDAKVTLPERGLAMVSAGVHSPFVVYFLVDANKNTALRVCWDGETKRHNLLATGVPSDKLMDAVAWEIRNHDEHEAFVLAERARKVAAHEAVEALRAEYGLVEDEGDLQVVETDYNSGRFDVAFKTGTPEKVAEVLKALRAAGII